MLASCDALARKATERRVIEDGKAIWMRKMMLDREEAARERKELREMLAAYNPWGKPGNGAPVPGALRKMKWTVREPEMQATSVMTLGRPGHGAPLRTISGKVKTLIKSDPVIRFQSHDSSRKSVENDLRYKASPADKENYRRELDAIVSEKSRAKTKPDDPSKWGRPGPGGKAWRDPGKLGRHFLGSMGWTDDAAFRRLVRSLPKCGDGGEDPSTSGGGVELVPLLARNRMVNRSPLSSTDVTKISKIQNGRPPKTSDYQRQLSQQVSERRTMMEEERREDMETSRKHFETWMSLWGRPGHGAPKGNRQREKLETILYYHVPIRRSAGSSAGKR